MEQQEILVVGTLPQITAAVQNAASDYKEQKKISKELIEDKIEGEIPAKFYYEDYLNPFCRSRNLEQVKQAINKFNEDAQNNITLSRVKSNKKLRWFAIPSFTQCVKKLIPYLSDEEVLDLIEDYNLEIQTLQALEKYDLDQMEEQKSQKTKRKHIKIENEANFQSKNNKKIKKPTPSSQNNGKNVEIDTKNLVQQEEKKITNVDLNLEQKKQIKEAGKRFRRFEKFEKYVVKPENKKDLVRIASASTKNYHDVLMEIYIQVGKEKAKRDQFFVYQRYEKKQDFEERIKKYNKKIDLSMYFK